MSGKKRKMSQNMETSEATSLNVLNDDCLLEIFHYLPITNQVRIERVCKRWKDLCDESWKNFKKLDLSKSTWGIYEYEIRKKFKIDLSFLKKHRAGEYVTCIDLSNQDYYRINRNNIITDIASNCPNLEEIDLTGLKVCKSEINILARNCSKIRKLSLKYLKEVSDEDLKALFWKNENLRYLKIAVELREGLNGSCLLALPADNVQELFIQVDQSSRRHPDLDFLFPAIRRLKNLKTLSLCMPSDDTFLFVFDEDLDAIVKHANSMTNLRLSIRRILGEQILTRSISKFVNLESLNVSQSNFGNEFFTAVGKFCKKLKVLDISGCTMITKEGLAALTSLPELECLKMNDLQEVTDAVLGNISSRLKVLQCRYCDEISDEGLLELISRSPELRLLDVSGCLNVSSTFMEATAAPTRTRTNGISLAK